MEDTAPLHSQFLFSLFYFLQNTDHFLTLLNSLTYFVRDRVLSQPAIKYKLQEARVFALHLLLCL